MNRLTIFTPTYNRAKLLPRLYQSLISQTNKNFVWLIVDDGSNDNTKEVVDQFIKENLVKIKYHYQNNAGKMQAHNTGVDNCDTELFFCVDSDDYIPNNAVEIILDSTNNLPENVGAIVAKKAGIDGSSMGDFDNVLLEKKVCKFKDILKIQMRDTSLIFRTKVLKEYPFPKFEGEKFISENYVYLSIDEKWDYMILNKTLTYCEQGVDGITNRIKQTIVNNPKSACLYYNLRLKLADSFKEKIKYAIAYNAFSLLTKNKKIIKNSSNKFLSFITFPLGLIVYYRRRKYVKK